jgi:hypothetical protein
MLAALGTAVALAAITLTLWSYNEEVTADELIDSTVPASLKQKADRAAPICSQVALESK